MQLIPNYLKIIFSGSYCKVHQNWLIRIVHEMTPLERMSVFVFIIGLEFIGGSQISIDLLNMDDDPCIQFNTCFCQLYLPPIVGSGALGCS